MTEMTIDEIKRENRLLREQIREVQNRFEDKIAELSIVREIGMALLHVSSFERACQFILDVIINNTVAQNCSIMLMDHDENKLFLVGATNPEGKNYVLEAGRVFSREDVFYCFKPGEGAAGQAMLEKRPVLIHDTKKSSSFDSEFKDQVKIGSLLSVPLMIEGEPFGVINLSHPATNTFETNDANLLNIVANFVAILIHSTLNYERLQYSEAKYRALSENSNNGIAIIQDGVHIYANPKYQEITGYSPENLKEIPLETLLDTSNTETDSRDIRSILKGECGGRYFEVQLLGQKGEKVEVEINSSPIIYSDKKALIISVLDLTDRKKLERQLQHARKMEALGLLAGGVAHDLNNVLSGIVSYPDLLLMDLPEDSPLRKPILTMQESGLKAAAIVQDLLTLARMNMARAEVLNLNDIVSDYLLSPEHEKLKAHHSNVDIETNIEADLLNIKGSSIHLTQTVMNLVSNAAEAQPSGGKIIISTKNQYIDRPIRGYENIQEGDFVVLRIEDSGIGIAPDDISRIFEPFYTKKVMGRSGTGLGMAVVWGTVKDHEGYIDISSVEGKGTICELYFPVTREEITKENGLIPIEDYMGSGETILVVDDIKTQREIASSMLSRLGYSVTTASSGEEAIEYIKNNPVDILVLDMIMDPGIDGLETYERILKMYPGQKAIIASGFAESDRVKETHKLGAGQYIKKPYTLEKVGIAVKKELSNVTPTPVK